MRILVVGLILVASCSPADPAIDVEERLLAPCCWRQSLRDHDSEIASRLRREIETRITAGEAPRAIEADLVRRYGEQLRALPAAGDPRWLVGVLAAVVAALGLTWIVVLGRRRGSSRWSPRAESVDDSYVERLEDELATLD